MTPQRDPLSLNLLNARYPAESLPSLTERPLRASVDSRQRIVIEPDTLRQWQADDAPEEPAAAVYLVALYGLSAFAVGWLLHLAWNAVAGWMWPR